MTRRPQRRQMPRDTSCDTGSSFQRDTEQVAFGARREKLGLAGQHPRLLPNRIFSPPLCEKVPRQTLAVRQTQQSG